MGYYDARIRAGGESIVSICFRIINYYNTELYYLLCVYVSQI